MLFFPQITGGGSMGFAFNNKDEETVSLGDYKPWSFHKNEGGNGSNYPAHSGYVLDVKDGKEVGINHFVGVLEPELKNDIAIAVVPSHDPAKVGGGLAKIASRLAAGGKRIDASDALRRTSKIQKLAHGGSRGLDVHLNSVTVANPQLIKGRDVLLLDDVKKTGHSLDACKELLLKAGAKSVQCAALGSTW